MCRPIRTMLYFSLLVFLSIVFAQGSENCTLKNGSLGICKQISNCTSAIKDLKRLLQPVICGFDGFKALVCCEENEKVITEERILNRISEKECRDYLELDIKPVMVLNPTLVIGGTNALVEQYPHMAILGYGQGENFEFKCGGSLISEQFILTAAHCLESREFGNVSMVRLGDLDIASTKDISQPQNFKVLETYSHPDYNSLSFYHDIALIKLDRPANYTSYVRPACLQTETKLERNNLTITGWGATVYGGGLHSYLQTADLMNLPTANCLKSYRPQPKLENGFQEEFQICGGNLEKKVDTCQGDSGGPIQVRIKGVPPMYKIVGVTSFGNNCGLVPGVYTRVSKYISWIESIVWPNQ